MLVLFYFLIAWKAPFPPIPEYGIELGFESSSGATPPRAQPLNEAEPTSQEEAPVEEAEVEGVPEIEENFEDTAETPPETSSETDISATSTDDSSQESPTNLNDTPAEQPSEETVEDSSDNLENTNETEEETQKEESAVEEEIKIDERAIYGSQGSDTGNTEGASLSLSGWIWDFKPNPDDSSSETGKIVYRISVDESGYLVKIEPISSTVSPAVERKYRQAVEQLTFSKTSDYQPAPLSTGTLTFIIKTK